MAHLQNHNQQISYTFRINLNRRILRNAKLKLKGQTSLHNLCDSLCIMLTIKNNQSKIKMSTELVVITINFGGTLKEIIFKKNRFPPRAIAK